MADLPQSDVLKTDLRDGWLRLTFDDPKRRNALSQEMSEALSSVLSVVADDRSVRGIVLRGAGGIFCSGGDLKGMAGHIMSGNHDAVAEMSSGAGRLFHQLAHQPQPVIALVEGPALAGGLGIVCCADIVVVTKDASFALTETQLGITPAQIAPYVVGRLGLPLAKRLMLTGSSFGGAEALALGLADRLVADGDALSAAEEDLRLQILRCAPGANAATKALAIEAAHTRPEAMIKPAANAFAGALLSDEGREGIASFVEKRAPRWRNT